MSDLDKTAIRLDAWFKGDAKALDSLLKENLDWMRYYVRRELEPGLRPRLDSVDVVQEAVARLLQRGPRYAPRGREEFRALLVKVLRGALGDQRDREHALKRDPAREQRLPSQGLSRFAPRKGIGGAEDSLMEQQERHARIERALSKLDPQDAEIIRLRHLEELSFAEIAQSMRLDSADAARMRFHRAMPRLGRVLDATD